MPLHPGDVQKVTATFKKEGVLTNPGVMTLRVREPHSETVDEYVYPHAILENPTTGVFIALIPITTDGQWSGAFIGTDPAPGSEPFTFSAYPLPV
jgi:hypothetical protein